MNTAIVSIEINSADLPTLKDLLKKIKPKSIKVEEKDPTEMSQEEFFAMIDKARAGKKIKMSREAMKELLLSKSR